MNHEQTPTSNSAQNETKKSQNLESLSTSKKYEIAMGLSALGLIGVAGLTLGAALEDNRQIESYRNAAPIQEAQEIPHGAEYANEYANKKEQERNLYLGQAAFTGATGIGALTLAAHFRQNRRTKEIIISGEKPTEQPKE